MYQTKNLGLNITEIDKDSLQAFNFNIDLGDNFKAIDEKTLSHRNITNCLLEVPQDIKAECSNGTLTIKAGTKIWIPYGIEDLTADYPVGSAFLNANFTVVETQYYNSRFFVCAEVQADITNSQTTLDVNTRLLLIDITENSLSTYISTTSLGTQSTENNNNNYRTDLNLIQKTKDGILRTNVMSLPLLVVSSDSVNLYAEINQVFNGFGYIGSTIFALPGVKGLIPDGRNEDGSYFNILYTIPNLTIQTYSDISHTDINLLVNQSNELNIQFVEYNENNNELFDGLGRRLGEIVLAKLSFNQGTITSFKPKKPFHAVDYNDYSTKIAELEAKIEALQTAVEALQG